MTPEQERHYRAMKRRAVDRVLFVSPPYSSLTNPQQAFLNGYDTALRDIALSRLEGEEAFAQRRREAKG
jgi:hypothetical protein